MSDIYIDRKSVTDPQEGAPDVVAFGRPVLSYIHFDPSTKLTNSPEMRARQPWLPECFYRRHGWILYVPPGVLKQCPEDSDLDDWTEQGGVDYGDWEFWTGVEDAEAVDEAYRVALAYLGKYSKPPTLSSVPCK